MPNEQLDQQAVALAKSIRQIESNNNFNAQGKSGEWGGYQFTPATWDSYSREFGVNAAFGSATPEQQNEVAYKKIKQWKDQGYNPGQIASMWNAGAGRPNAYQEGHKGVNKFGVEYDTADYAKKVAQTYQRLKPLEEAKTQLAQRTEPTPKEEKSLGRKGLEFLFPILEKKERTGLQTIGDLGLSALTLIPGLGAAGLGAKAANVGGRAALKGLLPSLLKASTIAKGAGAGYGVDVLSNLSKGETGGEAFTPGLGTALGGAIPFGSQALRMTGVGQRALGEKALQEAAEIVSPTLTKKNIKQGLKSGLVSKSGKGKISMGIDKKSQKSAESIQDLVRKGSIKATDTVEKKVNVVKDEITNVAKDLEKQLKSMEVQPILEPEDLQGLIERTQKIFKESPLLVGDAGKASKRIFDKFVSFLPEGKDVTALDLLKARKKLDSWIRSEGRSAVFDPRIETAISKGLREIRQGANKLIADKAPNVPVKNLLQKQSSMYDALDAIIENSWREVGTSGVQRYFKRHPYQKDLLTGGVKGSIPGLIGGGVLGGYLSSKLTGD